MLTPELLREIGRTLFPHDKVHEKCPSCGEVVDTFHGQLAAALGVNPRTVQRWTASAHSSQAKDAPPAIAKELQNLLKTRLESLCQKLDS